MELPPIILRLTPDELAELRYAKSLLEAPGFAARLAGFLGKPIEQGLALLPKGAEGLIHKAATKALSTALSVAITSLGNRRPRLASERWHKFLVGASGGVGGVFGLASLPVELPVSTTIMLRSIADIARSEGFDISAPAVKVSCLEVFALGGRSASDDAAESSYWIVRAALSKTVSEAATFLAQKGASGKSAPVLLRLVTAVASRFGVVVSEEIAAKAVPVVGAASGSVINVLFIDHFQDMARGHFIVKRLELRHGTGKVREAYQSLAMPMK